MAKPYNLAEIIKAEREKHGQIEIALGGGKSVHVDPPVLWPDEAYEVPDVEAAKLLLGDDYAAFVDAGGTAALLFRVVKDHQGASLGE